MTQSAIPSGIPIRIPTSTSSGFTSGTPNQTATETTTVPTLPGPHCNYSSDDIDSFLYSFDVLTHLNALDVGSLFTSGCRNLSVLKGYLAILPTSPLYQRIILEATSLCTAVNSYNGDGGSTSKTPHILTSSVPGELPIVINTGASSSITPILLDFTGPVGPCCTEALGSLTEVKTKIDGEGPVAWEIEDMNGVTKTINTTAYYVALAMIRIFSP